MTFVYHSTAAIWSSHKQAAIQMLPYKATLLQALEVASTEVDHVADGAMEEKEVRERSKDWKMNFITLTLRAVDNWLTYILTSWPNCGQIHRLYWDVSKKYPESPKFQFYFVFKIALYCTFCRQQSNTVAACKLTPDSLRQKLIIMRHESLKSLLIWSKRIHKPPVDTKNTAGTSISRVTKDLEGTSKRISKSMTKGILQRKTKPRL